VWCATSPQLDGKGGVYCVDCDIAAVIERDAAERLWQLSEEMTGVKFSN
jgi:hypothetical protein